jgi:hypothetical protein
MRPQRGVMGNGAEASALNTFSITFAGRIIRPAMN